MFIRQAITTKYLPCTNHRPSRIVATASAGRVYVSYDHGLNIDGNHAAAAQAFAEKFDWHGVWCAGGLCNKGNVFVLVSDKAGDTVEPAFVIAGGR